MTLNKVCTSGFEIGLNVARYLGHVIKSMETNKDDLNGASLATLAELKTSHTPAAKLFNWNLIIKELEKLNVPVDEDTRNLIIAGDLEMVAEVFSAIDSLEKKVNGTPSEQSQYRREENVDPKERVKEGVDILTMDSSKDPRKSDSSLEMILITLCASFNMKPKQAAALLTNSNQYLLHSVVKGLKGKFEPIQNWFKMLYNLTDEFENIMDLEKQV